MNAVVKMPSAGIPALAMNEQELVDVLRTSLYPGASDNSIKMVISYCKASSLDPMQKPVHLVPMWDSKTKQMRDVVMPGIGLYRVQAARTNEHTGTDKPVFGPMVEYDLSGVKVTVPEWCEVTVYRMKHDQKCAYTSQEFWIENYATAGKDTSAPNSMWKKRCRGQLAKCAEAQALRKGFPEVGNQPTADEMEGKVLDDYAGGATIDQKTGEVTPAPKPALEACNAEAFAAIRKNYSAMIRAQEKTPADLIAWLSAKTILSDEQKFEIDSWRAEAVEFAEVSEPGSEG